MPFRERDVSVDPAAAGEIVRRSGQTGVPVIVAGDEVIVGFDRPRLERLANHAGAPQAHRPRLGLRVKDAPGGGVEVGGVRDGSPAERAGLRVGDVVESVDGQPVRSAAELERWAQRLRPGVAPDVHVRRAGERLRLRLPVWS